MKKTLDIIIQFIVTTLMVSASHGDSQCQCNCDLKGYGVEGICNSVARATTKADTNEEAIKTLIKSYDEEILPFIKKQESLHPSTTTASTAPSTDVNASALDFLNEIEKLKKKFETEQRRLEGKIDILEKKCLEAVEVRTSNLEQEFAAKVDDVGNKISKVKEEVLEKINETADGTLQMKDEILKKVTKVEDNTLKQISELIVQVEKEDSELREMLNTEQGDQSYLKRRNKTLEVLKTRMENYTQDGNHVSLYKGIFGVLYDTLQAVDQQVLPTAQQFEEKSAYLEGVVRGLCCENVSTAEGVMTSTMATVESEIFSTGEIFPTGDSQYTSSISTESLTSIQNEVKQRCSSEYEIPTLNGAEATAKTCDIRPNYSEINSRAFIQGPLKVRNCGKVSLLDGNTRKSNSRTENCKRISFQFLLLAQKKLKDEEDYKNVTWAILLNDKWAISPMFFRPKNYRVQGETAEGGIFHMEVSHTFSITGGINLIRLKTSVPFSRSVNFSPPCLLGKVARDKLLLGPAIILAWDSLEKYEGFPQASLRVAEVCLMSDDECEEKYENNYLSYYDLTICTKDDEQVRELCRGTAGGGFLFKKIEGKEVLIGISYRCTEGKPLLFREPPHHLDTINSIIGDYP